MGLGPAGGEESRMSVNPSDLMQNESKQHIISGIALKTGGWIITGIVMSEYIDDAEAQGVQPCT